MGKEQARARRAGVTHLADERMAMERKLSRLVTAPLSLRARVSPPRVAKRRGTLPASA